MTTQTQPTEQDYREHIDEYLANIFHGHATTQPMRQLANERRAEMHVEMCRQFGELFSRDVRETAWELYYRQRKQAPAVDRLDPASIPGGWMTVHSTHSFANRLHHIMTH